MVLGDFEEEEEEENASNAKKTKKGRRQSGGWRVSWQIAMEKGIQERIGAVSVVAELQAFNEAEGEEDVIATNTATSMKC